MKRVFIIANLFHASPRIPGLAKYLPKFGWEPIVLTVPIGDNKDVHPNCRYIEVPYENKLKVSYEKRSMNIKKHIKNQRLKNYLYNLYGSIFYYPDAEKNWREPAIKKACEFINNEKIDALLSSSSPVTCHLIAKYLKEKYKIPWVADLRDLWTQNHNYPYGLIRKIIEKRLELKTLNDANVITTVSKPWSEKLKILYKKVLVYTITNGFDPDILRKKEALLKSKFTVTYTGQIYPEKQDPSKLFVALRELISEGTINPNNIEIRFYGVESKFLLNYISKYDLSKIVEIYEKIPRDMSIEKQRESHLLLLLNWEDSKEKGVYPLKVFEYLAAKRPILATGGSDDVIKDLLEETNAGFYCKTIEDVKIILRDLYSNYKNKNVELFNGSTEKINKYSYLNMAMKFAEYLNNCL